MKNYQLRLISVFILSSSVLFSCKSESDPVVESYGRTTQQRDSGDNRDRELDYSPNIDEYGNYIYDTGKEIEIELNSKIKLRVGENSVENKLFQMIKNDEFVISSDENLGWVTLDQLRFDNEKSKLIEGSINQVQNIVEILKAYPNSKIKIGGFMDEGDNELNKRLTKERAELVCEKLIASGIEDSRLSFQGYGNSHFVCPTNDTELCRAQNRRVDIRLIKK